MDHRNQLCALFFRNVVETNHVSGRSVLDAMARRT
jgi:hypothetical protein